MDNKEIHTHGIAQLTNVVKRIWEIDRRIKPLLEDALLYAGDFFFDKNADAFMEAQKRLTLEGNIVISVGLFGHSGDDEVWDGMDEGTLSKTKEMLDDMHKEV